MLVHFTNSRRHEPPYPFDERIRALINKDFFKLARPVHLYLRGPMVGSQKTDEGVLPMFATESARQAVTAFAGAFVTALLFVSAATSLPIA